MFETEYAEAAVEVLDILDNTKEEDVKKIPTSFLKFLVDIASSEYRVNLDHSKKIGEMNLKDKTRELLGVIYINWWSTAEEKEKFKKQVKELEIKKQEELRGQYNPDKIFENKSKIQNSKDEFKVEAQQTETVSMVEYKESIFKKIKNTILNFFKK